MTRIHRSVADAVRDVAREAWADDVTGEAAKMAYYLFLSLFPAILALFAFTGIFGGDEAFRWIMDRLRTLLPGDAAAYLERFVHEITGDSRPGILSFGLLLILWSASNVFAHLANGLNRMYDLEEGRPWWQRRLVALAGLVLGLATLTAGAVSLLMGPELIAWLGLASAWGYLRWPLVLLLVTLMLVLIYLLLPAHPMRWPGWPIFAGAFTGALLWMAATAGFRLYVSNFGNYSATYGFIGGIIVLLLWLYMTALVLLVGGEMAATLEQRRHPDWDVGEPPEGELAGR